MMLTAKGWHKAIKVTKDTGGHRALLQLTHYSINRVVNLNWQ